MQSTTACSADAECSSLADCEEGTKSKTCQEGQCACIEKQSTQGITTCSTDTECTTLPDCEEQGESKVCQSGQCTCIGKQSTQGTMTCSVDTECTTMSNCEGNGSSKVCQAGVCTCTTQNDDPSTQKCSSDSECTTLADCDGDGESKVCQGGQCTCKTEDDAAVTTTLTTLPPGASIQTITDDITENMVTTTTLDGSIDPTVVPIIVPSGKPPVICWGCVTLPTNAQIQVPEFCVKILGLKIGSCPDKNNQVNGEEGGGGDDNNIDNDNNKDNEDDKDDEKDENCVLTVTCTQNCYVQAQADAAAPQTTFGCETRTENIPCETPEPTECVPTSTSTTTTTTTTPAVSGSCSSRDCPNESCLNSKRGILRQKRKPLGKRAQPPPNDSLILVDDFNAPDNLDPDDRAAWFVRARALIDIFGAGNGEDGVDDMATSKMWDIDGLERPFITGAGPSWGCTTIIVYSNLGIYLAHLWEGEHMSTEEGFDDAKDFIRNGDPSNAQPSFETAANRYFNDEALFVQAFIFTPRCNSIRVHGDGTLIPEPEGGGRSPTEPWFKQQVDELFDIIQEFAPNAQTTPLPYELMSNQQDVVGTFGLQERTLAVVQYSPRLVVGDLDGCDIVRSWRIIHPLAQTSGYVAWQPTPPTLTKHKRAGDACPANAKPLPADATLYGEDGQTLDPGQLGGASAGTTVPPKTCSTAADCPASDCKGDGTSSACEQGSCVCKQPTLPATEPEKKCSSDSDCSGQDCAGGMKVGTCESGVCVCKSPEDQSICSNVDTCGYLECKAGEEKACADGRCQCQEEKCSKAEECDFLSCDADKKKVCTDGKCECQGEQEKKCASATDCDSLSCSDGKEKACEDSKCICKDKSPAFAPGTCNTHIREYADKDGFVASIQIFDGAGKQLYDYEELDPGHEVSLPLYTKHHRLVQELTRFTYNSGVTQSRSRRPSSRTT